MPLQLSPERVLLLLGLAFFFGLAFEEFYGAEAAKPPGGVRTFPLLAIAGGGLYLIQPTTALPFAVGLLALGAWLFLYYRHRLEDTEDRTASGAELMVPLCNLLAYLLGPTALLAPIWVGVGMTVAAVLLLGAREPLHLLARRVPAVEITTLGKFLILTGIVLPLLPNQPVTPLTAITPFQVWLAVVAVSTLSYLSYLAQNYFAPKRGSLLAALLGGLYSSTATTTVLARRLRQLPEARTQLQAGILAATAVMYLRIAVVVAAFDLPLARALVFYLLPLAAMALVCAWACYRPGKRYLDEAGAAIASNPLQLGTALLFALLFILVSLAASWARSRFGAPGLYWLAAIVGVSDIDPFVLSIAQGSAPDVALTEQTAAILVAASSNNLLKAVYAMVFAGREAGLLPASLLALLAAAGLLAAYAAFTGWAA